MAVEAVPGESAVYEEESTVSGESSDNIEKNR